MTQASTTQKNDKPAATATDKPKRGRKAKPLDKFQLASKASAELASLDDALAKAATAKADREKLIASLTPEVRALLGLGAS